MISVHDAAKPFSSTKEEGSSTGRKIVSFLKGFRKYGQKGEFSSVNSFKRSGTYLVDKISTNVTIKSQLDGGHTASRMLD